MFGSKGYTSEQCFEVLGPNRFESLLTVLVKDGMNKEMACEAVARGVAETVDGVELNFAFSTLAFLVRDGWWVVEESVMFGLQNGAMSDFEVRKNALEYLNQNRLRAVVIYYNLSDHGKEIITSLGYVVEAG